MAGITESHIHLETGNKLKTTPKQKIRAYLHEILINSTTIRIGLEKKKTERKKDNNELKEKRKLLRIDVHKYFQPRAA